MRIGIDLDGTACRTWETFSEFVAGCSHKYNESDLLEPQVYDFWTQWGMSYKEWWDLFVRFGQAGMFCAVYPYDGFARTTRRLVEVGHDVVIATGRVAGFDDKSRAKVISDTVDWLHGTSARVGDICFVTDKRNLNLDILIDDAPKHLQDAAAVGIRAIAFSQPYNRDWPGERVNNWQEFESLCLSL